MNCKKAKSRKRKGTKSAYGTSRRSTRQINKDRADSSSESDVEEKGTSDDSDRQSDSPDEKMNSREPKGIKNAYGTQRRSTGKINKGRADSSSESDVEEKGTSDDSDRQSDSSDEKANSRSEDSTESEWEMSDSSSGPESDDSSEELEGEAYYKLALHMLRVHSRIICTDVIPKMRARDMHVVRICAKRIANAARSKKKNHMKDKIKGGSKGVSKRRGRPKLTSKSIPKAKSTRSISKRKDPRSRRS